MNDNQWSFNKYIDRYFGKPGRTIGEVSGNSVTAKIISDLVPSSQCQDAIGPFMGVLVKVTIQLALLDGPEKKCAEWRCRNPNHQLQYGRVWNWIMYQ